MVEESLCLIIITHHTFKFVATKKMLYCILAYALLTITFETPLLPKFLMSIAINNTALLSLKFYRILSQLTGLNPDPSGVNEFDSYGVMLMEVFTRKGQ